MKTRVAGTLDGLNQELMYAGMEESAALSPLGTMKKRVPAARRVMMKGMNDEGSSLKVEG